MAQYVIPPVSRDVVFIKCSRCGTLYAPESPDTEEHTNGSRNAAFYYNGCICEFEPCPHCGYALNDWDDTISYRRYRMIAFFRKLFDR